MKTFGEFLVPGSTRIDEAMDGEQEKARRRQQMAKAATRIKSARPAGTIKKPTAAKPKSKPSPGLIGTRDRTAVPARAPKPEWGSGKTGTGYPKPKSKPTAKPDPGAVNPRGTTLGKSSKVVKDKAARDKNASRITKPATSLPKAPSAHRNNPAKTPEDNVAGAASRLKGAASKAGKKLMSRAEASARTRTANTKSAESRAKIAKRKNKISKVDDKRRLKDAKRKKEEEKQGFMGGLKKELGGDVFSKDKATRKQARRETGKSLGKFIKDAPGKIAAASAKGKGDLKVGESQAGQVAGSKVISRSQRS